MEKRKQLSKKQRQAIADLTNHRCGYCGDYLKNGWHADHIEPFHIKGNDELINFMAACPQCNLFKGGHTIESFRESLFHQTERARKTNVNYRFALKYKQIIETPREIVFYFEKLI